MGRPASDIRDRLLEAARTRFLQDGVDGASLREIARDAQTSLGMIVYYFPRKEDLFLGVLESAYEPLVDDLVAAIAAEHGTRERLAAVADRVARASPREIDVLRIVAREAIGSARRRHRVVRRFLTGHVPHLLGVLRDGVARGDLDASVPLPLLAVSFAALTLVPQVIARAVGGRLFPGRDVLARASIDLFFRAAGPRM